MKIVKNKILLTLSALIMSCGGSGSEVLENPAEAELCLRSLDDDVAINPGEELELLVFFSCYRPKELLHSECSATVVDDEIFVESSFEFDSEAEVLQTQCAEVWVSCNVSPLEEGTINISHGEVSRAVDMPSEDNLDCSNLVYLNM